MSRRRVAAIAFAVSLSATDVPANELCFVPSEPDQFNITVDCAQNPWYHNWIGYRVDGGEPCQTETDPYYGFCAGYPALDYTWTIRNSSTNPWSNSGDLDPEGHLYLWYACYNSWITLDFLGADFALAGTLDITSAEMRSGFVNFSSSPNFLVLAPECLIETPVLVAELTVETTTPVESTDWGQIKALYR